jgi:cytochrome c oxidase cbb3-type subunit 2
MRKLFITLILVGILSLPLRTLADTTEKLLDLLIEKGVITVEESRSLKEELKKEREGEETLLKEVSSIMQVVQPSKRVLPDPEEILENPVTPADIEAGKRQYEMSCLPCHGPEGKGDGPVAAYMDPRPRDLTKGLYKFRTTPSGELPTDWDLLKTITEGLSGTEMPGWKALSQKERWQVVQYIKTLAKDFSEYGSPEETVKVGRPIPPTPNSINKGRKIYQKAKCWECHGQEGKGDGPSAGTLKDDWGFSIIPTNLTHGWEFRRGNTPQDIFITLSTGINGTPMPSYFDSLSEEERWHLANYLSTLSSRRNQSLLSTFLPW